MKRIILGAILGTFTMLGSFPILAKAIPVTVVCSFHEERVEINFLRNYMRRYHDYPNTISVTELNESGSRTVYSLDISSFSYNKNIWTFSDDSSYKIVLVKMKDGDYRINIAAPELGLNYINHKCGRFHNRI